MTKKYLFDLHVHTGESSNCAGASAAELIKAYAKSGYSGVVITDHYTRTYATVYRTKTAPEEMLFRGYLAAVAEAQKWGMQVFAGMELTFVDSPNDFIILGIEEQWLYDLSRKDIYSMGLKAFYQKHHHDVLVIQAHPFRHICTPADVRYIDGIEVYNGNPTHQSKNHLAYAFWQKHKGSGLIAIAASDAHEIDQVGTAGVYFYQMPKNCADLAQMLRNDAYELAGEGEVI